MTKYIVEIEIDEELLKQDIEDYENLTMEDILKSCITNAAIKIEEVKYKSEEFYVEFKWYTSDVHAIVKRFNPELNSYISEEDAIKVLEACSISHSAEIGMNWDTIDFHVESLIQSGEIVLKSKSELELLVERTKEFKKRQAEF